MKWKNIIKKFLNIKCKTTAADIIRAAIPDADNSLCEHIIWGRTWFPFAPVDAKMLYKAAFRWKRACEHNLKLCDFCDRIAMKNRSECEFCYDGLIKTSEK